ncbi:hypothetical protein [Roseobacter sinensis]|uniref:Uncharacterized protein n=1 Tax=Roseobacter sinensis TaxID=2931391 RepID=A0ABT3BEJ2_9RHOB|nr:hypothetical protein [Roseobacter sp. WL0113]MCV3271990.1 hypothetical protein [Roseobacter sp. WL0113]
MRVTRQMTSWAALAVAALLLLAAAVQAAQADISRFVGSYTGSAEVKSADGSTQDRDMSVTISETKQGFVVSWTTSTFRPDGSTKQKSYKVEFVPSDRGDVYASAMKRNVFGHDVQLDPMKGEPYVWSRIEGDTLSVYSLFVSEDGGYEIQQFNRTLAEGGLELDYKSVRNGEIQRTVTTFLEAE